MAVSCFPSPLWKRIASPLVDLGVFGTIFAPSPSYVLSEKILAFLVQPSTLLGTIPTRILLWLDEEDQLLVDFGLQNLGEFPVGPSHSSQKHSEDICSQETRKR